MSSRIHAVAAGEFKAHCLQLMDEVQHKKAPIVITKRGVPIAKLVPYEDVTKPLFGCMKGSVTIKGDIVSPIDEKWSVENE